MSKEKEETYLFEPWDGTPGDAYDKWERRLKNFSTKSDDRGWSYADHFEGNDEMGPTGPPAPGGAAGAKAQAAMRKRQKESYSMIVRHITSTTITDTLGRYHFQNGRAAFLAVQATGTVAVDRLKLSELDDDWKDISMLYQDRWREARDELSGFCACSVATGARRKWNGGFWCCHTELG